MKVASYIWRCKRGPCFEFAGHVDRIADERDLSGDCSMTWWSASVGSEKNIGICWDENHPSYCWIAKNTWTTVDFTHFCTNVRIVFHLIFVGFHVSSMSSEIDGFPSCLNPPGSAINATGGGAHGAFSQLLLRWQHLSTYVCRPNWMTSFCFFQRWMMMDSNGTSYDSQWFPWEFLRCFVSFFVVPKKKSIENVFLNPWESQVTQWNTSGLKLMAALPPCHPLAVRVVFFFGMFPWIFFRVDLT